MRLKPLMGMIAAILVIHVSAWAVGETIGLVPSIVIGCVVGFYAPPIFKRPRRH